MKNRSLLLLVCITAVFFAFLFYHQSVALNLTIYELLLLAGLLLMKKLQFRSLTSIVVLSGFIVSSILVTVNHSVLSIVVNIISFVLLAGVLLMPEIRSVWNAFLLSGSNIFTAQGGFFELFSSVKSGKNYNYRLGRSLRIIFIPVLIFFLFVTLYRAANPVFENYLVKFNTFIADNLEWLVKYIKLDFILLFILGLLLANWMYLGRGSQAIKNRDISSEENLVRTRKKKKWFRRLALLNEYRSAIFLLWALNGLILILNVIDIQWVWFTFEWNGEYLKQFVHEGTYLLILSIIISIVITLYFFRGNLNFFSRNTSLKYLSYAWLFQNAILTISVLIRNFRYIDYFALAYKRIGVIFFLLLTIYGLYTVYVKISKKKTRFYLLRANGLSLYIVLVFMAIFNWDVIIARYNFSHHEKSFVHLDFLVKLGDKALPYLDKSQEELTRIKTNQEEKFAFRTKYMSPEDYYLKIQTRKFLFMKEWENTGWLSLSLADHKAYKRLASKK